MFQCILCPRIFKLEGIEDGLYFPSTGICVHCYWKMFKNKRLCFGKEKKFDLTTIACGTECPDSRICRSFVKHRKEFILLLKENR